MKRLFLIPALFALLAACAAESPPPDEPVAAAPGSPANPVASPDDYAPRSGDERLLRGNVYLDSAQLLILESQPPQIRLALAGNLPDPCHRLRVRAAAPDEENRIRVEVYSLADPTAVCIQVLQPFQASIPLPLEGLPPGHYTVWVNGEKVGEFDR